MTTAKLPTPIASHNPVVILRHVIKAIEAEPKRYDQMTFLDRRGLEDRDFPRPDEDYPACGTICCVAGWVAILKGQPKLPYGEQEYFAADVLGLDAPEALQLFAADAVPRRDRIGVTRHAKAGIAHIRRFALKKWGVRL